MFEMGFTILVLALVLGLLIFSRTSPEMVLLGGVTLFLAAGIIDPTEAFHGFSSTGVITVGVLYVVVTGVQETGGIQWIVQQVLGKPRGILSAQSRLLFPVVGLSAFLNNTPVVGMFIPAVLDWARAHQLSVSRLLLPLSYASILGGTCTLIGTSTNLVVNGYITSNTEIAGLGMFDITWVGIPAVIVGMGYILFLSYWLIPDRRPAMNIMDNPREYTVEMLVEPGSPLVDQTIEQAGLRNLPGLYLMEIDREGMVFPAVGPHQKLLANDRLIFTGIVESVVDLQRIRGLTPATDQVFKLDAPRKDRILIEAVVSNSCPLVGRTVKEGRFRTRYNAVVIAVARNGERIQKKIGDIRINAGDTLLLEAHPSFVDQQRNSRDFFLVSGLENSQPLRHEKSWLAVSILAAMVILFASGAMDIVTAAMLAAAGMLLTQCCSVRAARQSIDWPVLMAIGASFGIGQGLENSGVANLFATYMIGLCQQNPWLILAAIYFITNLFTQTMSNNAAAIIVLPIALDTVSLLGVNPMPFIITVMIAASAEFATPIGYQTNLMVYGPGGYRFSDYIRVGIPLNVLIFLVTITITPFIWPF